MTERNKLIDNLRGFSILIMILTHVTAFFPNDKLAFTIWNWSNFAVPIFIFCSTYLFLQKGSDKPVNYLTYLKKRFLRLLIPYYIFLFFFLILLLFINAKMVTFKYIWQSILVIGGVDINWLVLLFLCITTILPIFVWSLKKSKLFFWLYFVLSFGSSIGLLFFNFPMPYKFIMWLPWSIVIYVTYFYLKSEINKKRLVILFFSSLFIFISSYIIQSSLNHSLVLIHNKYPPNIFFLSYGIAVMLGLIFIQKYIFSYKIIFKILHFFSKYSYSIYFLHYLILTFLANFIKSLNLNWITLLLPVLLLTIFLQFLYVSKKSVYNKITS